MRGREGRRHHLQHRIQAATEEKEERMATLPIVQYEEKIIETVENNSITVIIGETGSGKSTQLSQMLHRRGYSKIAVTQPRRVAAVSVSRSVSIPLSTFQLTLAHDDIVLTHLPSTDELLKSLVFNLEKK